MSKIRKGKVVSWGVGLRYKYGEIRLQLGNREWAVAVRDVE